jgi:PhnB protein
VPAGESTESTDGFAKQAVLGEDETLNQEFIYLIFMSAKFIPEGYHTTTPYLILRGAAQALDFYAKVFGAKEIMRMPTPDGHIAHAEMQIGDSRMMLADEMPGMPYKGPQSLGGTSVCLMIYVPDVDKVFAAALSAGATVQEQVKNQFYGDRSGTVKDPFGHLWNIATHVEDVSPEEMGQRAEKWMKDSQKAGTAA